MTTHDSLSMTLALEEEPATVIPPHTVPGSIGGASLNLERSGKRRKVRKGTRSCWECKRRKIRCTFVSSEDAACVGCQRRRAACVGQEMPEDLAPRRTGNRDLSERIARIEHFMKNSFARKNLDAVSQVERETQRDGRSNSDAQNACANDSIPPSSSRALLTPSEVDQPLVLTLDAFPNYRLASRRIYSKSVTPHTGLRMRIRPI